MIPPSPRPCAPTFPGLHVGIVEAVKDHGRIQVSVPSIFEETRPEAFAIARPCFPYGHFFVPEVGDKVWVAFENGDPAAPVWLGIWYPEGTVPPEAGDEAANHRVIRTSSGHLIQLDDRAPKLVIRDAAGNSVTLDGSGVTLTDKSGTSLELSSLRAWLEGLAGVFAAWVPAKQDGGEALQKPLSSFLGSNPVPMKVMEDG